MQIKDFTSNKHKSINPQNHKNIVFYHYSLPAFDNGKTVSNELGNTILSNKFYLNKSAILFNKLNIKFKRIWNIKNPVENSICSSEFIPLTVDESICLQDYLYYFLCSEPLTNKLLGCVSGTSNSQQRIRPEDLLKQEIVLPSLDFQRHIVDILGSIDDSIENNNKLQESLEDLAIKKYFSIADKAIGFTVLDDVVEIYDSKRIPLSSRERDSRKGSYPYYGATGILDYVDDYIFSGEYILFAEDGTVMDANGYPIVQLVTGDFWVNNHAHILTAKNGYTNYSLYVALKRLSVSKAVTGAVQLKINQANLCALELPKMDESTLDDFNHFIEPIFKRILHIRAENTKLNELKQLYLKKFFG